MKKVFFFTTGLLFVNLSLVAQQVPDSLRQVSLDDVVVSSTRVSGNTSIAYSNLDEAQIKQVNAAKNVPYILQTLPSVVAFSEDGSGVGNTSFRVRGTDAARINVTLNGMPLNEPESQEVFWVDFPDLSNSLQSLQLQRGVGTSTNGSASFGASLSLKTLGAKPTAYAEASTSFGSYNTVLSSVAGGTGILKNGFSFDGRYSSVTGDGYIRNGKVNHKSIYAAISHYSENSLLRLCYMNGIEHTGITWDGISPEQMAKDRRYNPAGEYYDNVGNVYYYDNETDNYYSNIVQLTYSKRYTRNLNLNANLSYKHGYGYYEEYTQDQNFANTFGLGNQTLNDSVYQSSDVVTRKLMSTNLYVANMSLNYSKNRLNVSGGGALSIYNGDNYGRLLWAKYNQNIQGNYQWYTNDATKNEFNLFTKIQYQVTNRLSIAGDFQYRHINYKIDGIDDDMSNVSSNNNYNFFNPKAGISYQLKSGEIYASFAIANREPLRADLLESAKGRTQQIKPERLLDYEFGYKYSSEKALLNANFYYMDYKDQMVQTGELNSVGYKLMQNVAKSYRMGIELVGAYQFNKLLGISANMTLSQNKIHNYTAYYDVYDKQTGEKLKDQKSIYYGKTNIAFSPQIISSSILTLTPWRSSSISLVGKYVGSQFYDNSSNPENELPNYFVANMTIGYTFVLDKIGKLDLQLTVNNLLDKEYVANAWTYSPYYTDGSKDVYTGLYPQATRNFMFRAVVKL